MQRSITIVKKFLRDERAATAVEYALLVVLIASVIAGAVASIGPKLVAIFSNATTWF